MKGELTMEKEKYISPEMEIIRFDTEDIIITSPPYEDDELPLNKT